MIDRFETTPLPRRIPVTVLGATGLVGQRLIALLAEHPWFVLAHVTGSARTQGMRYGDAVRWRVETPPPSAALDLPVEPPTPAASLAGHIVCSALPASEAETIEPLYAAAGALVFSNASAYRMAADVPLIIPEINPDHLAALATQRQRRGWSGALVTNPNCSTIGLALALAPLQRFGLRRVLVTTLQAASGAGYPGVASLDLLDNVIPYIGGEEDKIETETRKILGAWSDTAFAPIPADAMRISATCTRVPVRDGHLETVSVEFDERVTPDDIIAAWQAYAGEPQQRQLPTAPPQPLVYRKDAARPQPLYDRLAGHGMAVTLGRLRPCEVLDYKFVCLSHNTIRGAAGAALLNAELAYARGLLA
ncbi:MAG: Aspartate-semialdehyde dehydrogenase [Ktedonobacterales bacterium]|jgi:aspartate-semialdehyde dehydrogenase|nr:MAG: Aspartate-semialdehyde dehydrogenase [Ktedonobacterales bacterium]